MERDFNVILGKACQLYRKNVTGKLQSDVGRDVGFSSETVSSFETGRNNNALILWWYVAHGFSKHYLMGVWDECND